MDDCLRWSVSHRWYSYVQLADQSAWRPQCRGEIFDVSVYSFVDRSTWMLSCIQALENRVMMKPKIAIFLPSLVVIPCTLDASTLTRVIER